MATYLLSTDRQHSVLGSTPSHSRAYSPYGALITATGPGLGFGGQHRDRLIGCYPLGNGHRFYSPTLMRFLSADAYSPFDRGGINAYAYCDGDPVNRYDPSGASWLSVILRSIGVLSSGATWFGATARTMKNIVGRRSANQAAARAAAEGLEMQSVGAATATISAPLAHEELAHLSRVSNQQFAMTGVFGVAGQITAAVYGVSPNIQTLTDVLALGNTITNLSGGSIGNIAAAREVYGYLRRNPREVGSVGWETLVDLTMVDEMLSAVARGIRGTVRRIWPTRSVTHELRV